MTRNEVTVPNGFIDFLTFVSPVFVVAVFFLCLFRFLFRCCFCGTKHMDLEEGNVIPTCCQNHCSRFLNRDLAIQNGSTIYPAMSAYPNGAPNCCIHAHGMSMIGDSHLDVTLLEDSYPPKYEDALKLPAATPRDLEVVVGSARSSVLPFATQNDNGPPPFYEHNTIAPEREVVESRRASQSESQSFEPPAYSISVISSSNLNLQQPLFYPSVTANPTEVPLQRLQRHSSATVNSQLLNQERPCSSGSTSSWIPPFDNSRDEIKEPSMDRDEENCCSRNSSASSPKTPRPSIRRPVRFMTASISTFISKSGGSQRRKSLKSLDAAELPAPQEQKRPLTAAAVACTENNNEKSLKDDAAKVEES